MAKKRDEKKFVFHLQFSPFVAITISDTTNRKQINKHSGRFVYVGDVSAHPVLAGVFLGLLIDPYSSNPPSTRRSYTMHLPTVVKLLAFKFAAAEVLQ